jgi:hypothetical protein
LFVHLRVYKNPNFASYFQVRSADLQAGVELTKKLLENLSEEELDSQMSILQVSLCMDGVNIDL